MELAESHLPYLAIHVSQSPKNPISPIYPILPVAITIDFFHALRAEISFQPTFKSPCTRRSVIRLYMRAVRGRGQGRDGLFRSGTGKRMREGLGDV